MSKKSVFIVVLILLVGMMISTLNTSLMGVFLPSLQDKYGISADTAQWLITGFQLVSALFIPISVYLIKRFKYKYIFIVAMASFTIGSLVCGLGGLIDSTAGFGVLMVGRIFQAAAAGILMPLTLNIVTAVFPKEKRGAAMGIVGLGILVAPAIGPTVGGWALTWSVGSIGWGLLFYIFAGLGVLITLGAWKFFKINNETERAKLDVVGTLLVSVAFASLLFGISYINKLVSDGASSTWGIVSLCCLAVSIIVFAVFAFHQLKLRKRDESLVELRVLKNFTFTYATIIAVIGQIVLYGSQIMMMYLLMAGMGKSTLDAGLAMLPGGLVLAIGGIIAGRVYDRFGMSPLALVGTAIMAGALIWFTQVLPGASYGMVMGAFTLLSFGMSLILMPLTSAGLARLTPEQIPHGNALSRTLTTVAGAIGTALFVTVYMTVWQDSSHLATGNVPLAFVDGVKVAFWVMFGLTVSMTFMSIFIRKGKQKITIEEKEEK